MLEINFRSYFNFAVFNLMLTLINCCLNLLPSYFQMSVITELEWKDGLEGVWGAAGGGGGRNGWS